MAVSAGSNVVLRDDSAVADRLSEEEKLRHAEAYHLRHALGDDIWPGWGTLDIPQIVYNERYALLLAYPDPPNGWFREPAQVLLGGPWEMVPEDDFRGEPYYRQRLDSGAPRPQALAVRVGERWTGSIMTLQWAPSKATGSSRISWPHRWTRPGHARDYSVVLVVPGRVVRVAGESSAGNGGG
jgi:hypothetical protein